MKPDRRVEDDNRPGTPAGTRAREALALAASPVFAAMALVTGLTEMHSVASICGAAGTSPLTSMTTMYLMMGVFHAGPWLARLRRQVAPTGTDRGAC